MHPALLVALAVAALSPFLSVMAGTNDPRTTSWHAIASHYALPVDEARKQWYWVDERSNPHEAFDCLSGGQSTAYQWSASGYRCGEYDEGVAARRRLQEQINDVHEDDDR